MAAAVTKVAATVAGAAAAVPDGRRTSRKLLARPRRIVSRQTGGAAQAAWSLIVALLALSLLALVLRVANNRPQVVTGALSYVPNQLRKFVNPFGDNPLAGRPKTTKPKG